MGMKNNRLEKLKKLQEILEKRNQIIDEEMDNGNYENLMESLENGKILADLYSFFDNFNSEKIMEGGVR